MSVEQDRTFLDRVKGFSAISICDRSGWRTTRSMLPWGSPSVFSSACSPPSARALRFYRREKEKRREPGNIAE